MTDSISGGHTTVAFVGGGHMARALIGGLLESGWPAALLSVSDPDAGQRAALERDFPGLRIHASNDAAVAGAASWVLAVKPQQLADVVKGLAARAIAERALVVSIAAGVRASDLARWLGPGVPLVRSMPNRPALVGAGITALYAAPGVEPARREQAARILSAVGQVVWLDDERDMDAVTALSGSGPAYLFLLIEMMEAAGRAEGLPAATARRLAVATVSGAARMAEQLGEDPATLREQVTSRGGTTAAALEVLERAGIRDTFARAVHAGRVRSEQLADDLASKDTG